jgi:aldose sugar dehydrogenase
MSLSISRTRLTVTAIAVSFTVAAGAAVVAQQVRPPRNFPLGDGPWVFDTVEGPVRVVVVSKGISHPWSLAFLPDGSMLVTERGGRLRIIRNGVLDPQPIAGVPQVHTVRLAGLMDVVLHPRFAENHLVYLTYSKAGATVEKGSTTALARGRFDARTLTLADVRDIFVADAWGPGWGDYGSRLAFGKDGMLYMTIGDRADPKRAQDTSQHAGTIVRLRDDGSVPDDNPFVGKAGYRPEIYSYGHRSEEGLVFHPVTGALWETEHGPNGGDEINIIQPGGNYGWPIVTFGHNYDGTNLAEKPWHEGMLGPQLFWVPSIATSGLAFYTGDRFPAWKGNVFVGGMRTGEIAGTGHLERLVFSEKTGGELRRESLLTELHQRIRDVRQGPDGLLYLLTEEEAAALLRIEPVEPAQ